MARLNASELAQRLGREAEAVCRYYLSNGRKQGNYWQVGDVQNSPGRSMFVRLTGPESGITRDSISLPIDWEGVPMRIFDTAGMRKKA